MRSPSVIVREARNRAGLTQRQLASKARTAQSVVARIELGVENLTDERYLVAADTNVAIGYEVGVYARPRNWSLSVERRF